jgi:23S rRNA (cytosine1962-C5)-methyltransferase
LKANKPDDSFMMKDIETRSWNDYELIDSGNFQKLERFGAYVLIRPEPKALWDKALSDAEWQKAAHAVFKKTRNIDPGDKEETGEWITTKGMPQQWKVSYPMENFTLRMRLGLTPFRHIGLFPEQAANWDFIYESVQMIRSERPRVLNLFAYTGAASIVARAAGAEVVHVEALKQLITWTRENMELNNLDGIRWMLDDVVKFVKREIRRGNQYHGIIMDPPAYGRGPDGEKWILEEQIASLLKDVRQILHPHTRFFVLNLYAKGISPMITENLFDTIFGKVDNKTIGELYITDRQRHKMPYGSLLRFREI